MLTEPRDGTRPRPLVGAYTRPVGTLEQPGPAGSAGGPTPPPEGSGFWWRATSPVLALLGAFILGGLLVVPLTLTDIGTDGLLVLAQFLGGVLIVTFAVLLVGRLPEAERRAALATRRPLPASIGIGLAMGVALIVISGVIIALGLQLDPAIEEGLEEAAIELESVPWQDTLIVIAVALLAPVGEELLFRGLLFRALVARMRFGLAAVLSSVVFAAAHFESYLLWPRFIQLVVAGLVLAWVYQRRGLLAAIVTHATLNGVVAIVLLAAPEGS